MYVAPALWVGLAVLAIVRFLNVIWLVIVGKSDLHTELHCHGPAGKREIMAAWILGRCANDLVFLRSQLLR